jgi:hypothetical protein
MRRKTAIRMNVSLPHQRSQNARTIESATTVSVRLNTLIRCHNMHGTDS